VNSVEGNDYTVERALYPCNSLLRHFEDSKEGWGLTGSLFYFGKRNGPDDPKLSFVTPERASFLTNNLIAKQPLDYREAASLKTTVKL